MTKTIITVQHTESEHHINGHAGAWGNWSLTEKGRQQAFEIGKPWDWYDEHKKPSNGYDPDYRPFDDADSDRDLWNRLYSFYEQIIESDDAKILIVSHGCTLSFLQAMFIRFKFEDIEGARFKGRSGSMSKFTIDPNGRVTANYINHRLWE